MDSFRSTHPQPAAPRGSDVRDSHVIRLLFEARALAWKHFRLGIFDGVCEVPGDAPEPVSGLTRFVCRECGTVQSREETRLEHGNDCSVGAVLIRLSMLGETVGPVELVPHCPALLEADGGPQLFLGLPLRVMRGAHPVIEDADGRVIVDMAGSDLVDREEILAAERIAASVNACAVLTRESLRALVSNRMARAAMCDVYCGCAAGSTACPLHGSARAVRQGVSQ